MIQTLKIKNLVIIDSVEIGFRRGLNVLSGETGAGKSIVIEAIALLLGGRANVDLIRNGQEEAVVEGIFDIAAISWARQRLERLGFSCDSSELLIKRIVSRSGRHRIYINGELATLTILQDLCDGLVDLCSQHEHQSLVKPNIQLELLDRYGGLGEQLQNYAASFSHHRSATKEFAMLKGAEEERAKKVDFLRFQINELREANLKPNEDEQLAAEKQLLQSAEQRVQTADTVRGILESDEEGAMSALRTAFSKLRALVLLDEKVAPIGQGLERAVAEIEEAVFALNKYVGSIEVSSDRLVEVQERLALIADFRRKYGTTVGEMIARLSVLENDYQNLDTIGQRLEEVSETLEKSKAELMKLGDKLSSARKKVSDLFAKTVSGELKDLKMPGAKLIIEVMKKDFGDWTVAGADSLQFLVKTNPGEEAKPLGKIASGGELSRIMLAVRRVIADRGGIGVYLFDEIDAGIGGQTAFEVGKKLKSVAGYNQVICITHLPQIASFADHQLSVRKSTRGNRTVTEVLELSAKERKEELARMLGGPQLTKRSLENAAELIQLSQ